MAGHVVALNDAKTIAYTADAFLSRDIAMTTRRSYAQTMNRIMAAHGELPVGALDGAILDAFTAGTWGECGPATWNRHVATLRSFTAFARRHGWLAGDPAAVLERRTEPADRTKAIARSALERLFRRDDVALREKCLWRLLYETAARAQEVLSADVADIDPDNKRMRVRRKGGDSDWLHFQSGAARLLPRLIGDRDAGPIFLADRRPSPVRASASLDQCPTTGRGRLSYERSAYLFKQHSLKVSKTPWTLHHYADPVIMPRRARKSAHVGMMAVLVSA
jgi:integrase/recombinase XerC/integrase/recombinase XerD